MGRDQQKAYRKKQKALRRPGRDDVARVVLHWALTEGLRKERHEDLDKLGSLVASRLAEQGFDQAEARRRFDELLERYQSGWSFQRKRHLVETEEAEET